MFLNTSGCVLSVETLKREAGEVSIVSPVTYDILLMVYHCGLMFNKQREGQFLSSVDSVSILTQSSVNMRAAVPVLHCSTSPKYFL